MTDTQSLGVGLLLIQMDSMREGFYGGGSVLHLYYGIGYMIMYLSKFIEVYTKRSKFYSI